MFRRYGIVLLFVEFNSRPHSYPKSTNLPNIRVNDNVAFYGTGVDCLGPFYGTGVDYLCPLYCTGIYDVNSLEDCYGLFVLHCGTCASTRGVVLESVSNESLKYFTYSFRKFIVRRGCPGE